MPDVTGLAAGLVTILTAVGGGIAWWMRRRDSQKDPLPKQAAAVALAEQSVSLASGLLNNLDQRMQDIEADLAQTKRRLSATEETVDTLKRNLQAAISWIEDALRRRGQSLAPVPLELIDLIDPSLRDLDAET